MKTVSLLIVLLLAAFCQAADVTPEQVTAMFKEGEAQRAALVDTATQRLAATQETLSLAMRGKYERQDLNPNRFYWEPDLYLEYKSDVEREKAVKALEKEVAALKASLAEAGDKRIPVIPEIRDFLEYGKIGRLPYGAKIQTRQSKTQALAMLTLSRSVGQAKREAIAYVWGVDCTDDSLVFGRLQLPGVFMVTGTKMLGSFEDTEQYVVEPVDVSAYVKAEAARQTMLAAEGPGSSKLAAKKSSAAAKKLPPALKPVRPVGFMSP